MNTTLLIPSDDLKKYGLITSNVDVSYINPCIISAQDIDLQQLIGTKLYKRLLSEIEIFPGIPISCSIHLSAFRSVILGRFVSGISIH